MTVFNFKGKCGQIIGVLSCLNVQGSITIIILVPVIITYGTELSTSYCTLHTMKPWSFQEMYKKSNYEEKGFIIG